MGLIAGEHKRVQTLSEQHPSLVPPEYIQAPENRPQTKTLTTSSPVPVIDLFGFDPDHWGDVRRELARACREWGAFQVTNHGVPTYLLHHMRSVGLSFFRDTPMADKLRYACPPGFAASEGYGSRMLVSSLDDTVLDWRDYFDHHTLPLSRRNPSRWPDFPPNYRCLLFFSLSVNFPQ